MGQKIIHFVNQSTFGGTQHYILNLARPQAFNGHEVIVAAGEQPNEQFISECQMITGVRFQQLSHVSSRISLHNDLLSIFELRSLIQQLQPSSIHVHSPKLNLLAGIALKCVGLHHPCSAIYTAHGFWLNESKRGIKYLIHYLIEWLGIRFMDAVICVSRNDASDMKRTKIASRRTRLYIIHPALQPKGLPTHDDARRDLQKLIPTPLDDKQIIGCIANLYPGKGANVLIEALTRVSNSNVVAIIIGSGPMLEPLTLQATSRKLQDKVFLIGYQSNASRFIPAFDVFTLPSEKEGLPMVLLEAVAAGTPVVTTNVGGIPEIQQSNWILIPPRDPVALAKSLEIGLTLPKREPKSLEQLQKEYDEFLRKTDEVYTIARRKS